VARLRAGFEIKYQTTREETAMGKGNHSQKNDKKNKKPKQEKAKPASK
jgi:hypothetical protein